jgi:hypothetical protein
LTRPVRDNTTASKAPRPSASARPARTASHRTRSSGRCRRPARRTQAAAVKWSPPRRHTHEGRSTSTSWRRARRPAQRSRVNLDARRPRQVATPHQTESAPRLPFTKPAQSEFGKPSPATRPPKARSTAARPGLDELGTTLPHAD